MYAPWIFAEITGGEMPDKKALILKQIDDTVKYFGERFACVFMRKMAGFYLKGAEGAASSRVRLFNCTNTEQVKDVITTIL